MSTNALRTAVTGAPAPTEKPQDIFGMLRVYQGEIARALPKHMTPERMARIVTTEIRRNPALLKCNAVSLFGAVISASQLGLEPGLNGRGFLVPYKDECQFIPGWKGMVELANRTGRASCWTGAVFEGDMCEYQLGDSPRIRHVPMGEDDPAKITHVYAVGRVRGGEWPIVEVWPVAKVRKHRDRFNRQGTKHYSYREWEMYARKVPLLQVLKYLPASPELEAAIGLSESADMGAQGLTIDGVMSQDYTPPAIGSAPVYGPGIDAKDMGAIDGEVDASGKPTYAYVRQAIEGAESKDELDLAESLVDGLPEQFRPELHAMAKERRKGDGEVTR